MTNDESQMTNLKSAFRFFVILCVLCASAGNFSGQEVSSANRSELNEQTEIFSLIITSGTVEQKRDALLQIRNLRSVAASRIAVPALRDASEIVRATAAASVVFLPAAEAFGNLMPLLTDKKPFVRREAAYALGKVGDSLAVNPLLRVVQNDKVAEVRRAAIIALGEISDVAAVPELVKILQRKPQTAEEFARRSAARSIGQIAQIIQTGKIQVLTPENFLPEPFKSIERTKHPLLTEQFPPFRAAVGTLIEALQSSVEFPDVKREAAFALGAIGDESAVAVLRANAVSEDYYLAEICREALRKIHVAVNRRKVDEI